MDRFAMRLTLGYTDPVTEVSLLDQYHRAIGDDPIAPVTDPEELDRLIGEIDHIVVAPSIQEYIVAIAGATRVHPDLRLGVSTRGTLTMLRLGRAFAASEARDFVTPDDVKSLAQSVFAHRMALTAEAELRGVRIETVLADIVDELAVPRTREG
jgi:MoxR-like ATPase